MNRNSGRRYALQGVVQGAKDRIFTSIVHANHVIRTTTMPPVCLPERHIISFVLGPPPTPRTCTQLYFHPHPPISCPSEFHLAAVPRYTGSGEPSCWWMRHGGWWCSPTCVLHVEAFMTHFVQTYMRRERDWWFYLLPGTVSTLSVGWKKVFFLDVRPGALYHSMALSTLGKEAV